MEARLPQRQKIHTSPLLTPKRSPPQILPPFQPHPQGQMPHLRPPLPNRVQRVPPPQKAGNHEAEEHRPDLPVPPNFSQEIR